MRKINFLLLTLVCAFLSIASESYAQDNKFGINTLRFEARADFNYFNNDGASTSGFDGKYLNVELKGEFLEKFSYRYRQRLNIANSLGSKTFYQGTDWLALTYNANDNFSITSGKLCVGIGGWEYDLPPIDVYYGSLFWNNVNCYDVGAQLNFTTNDKNHTISLQVTNSPFSMGAFEGMYAYNLMWFGKMGFFRTSYSFNMMEQRKGQFINYIALGNAFDFGRFNCFIDFMNRGFFDQADFFLGDFTLIGEIKYTFCDKFKAFVKGGYDKNKNKPVSLEPTPEAVKYDFLVMPGVEYAYYGVGFECFPYKGNENIRIHGFFAANNSNLDNNISETGSYIGEKSKLNMQFNLGLTWRIDFIK